jgi:hypothetical protein
MSLIKPSLAVLCTGLFLVSCWDDNGPYTCSFSETPVALTEFNTIYDDYNSALPIVGETSPLLFSTNRATAGQDFDFICKFLSITFNFKKNKLDVSEFTSYGLDVFHYNANVVAAASRVNNSSDQLGPFLLPRAFKTAAKDYYNNSYQSYIFLYSSNEEGNQDIHFMHNLYTKEYTSPKEVSFLNSAQDDLYPFITQDSSSLYFCSNRGGNFDIYSVDLDAKKSIVTELENVSPRTIVKENTLSTPSDDKCPFIFKNLMIFTSNRPGGFGGYDLYYSVFKNGTWSAPVNFGEKINTAADEYRPVLKLTDSSDEGNDFERTFNNDFMIFSSNRPGGKGGFDLYYVGISQLRGSSDL